MSSLQTSAGYVGLPRVSLGRGTVDELFHIGYHALSRFFQYRTDGSAAASSSSPTLGFASKWYLPYGTNRSAASASSATPTRLSQTGHQHLTPTGGRQREI